MTAVPGDPGEHGRYQAEIPGAYTDSPFPLQYFFQVQEGDHAYRWPSLGPDLTGQPYYVLRRA